MMTNNDENEIKITEKVVRGIPTRAARIKRYKDRLTYLRAKSTCLPGLQTDDRVQTSRTNRSMTISDTLMDLEHEITKEEAELESIKRAASNYFRQYDLTLEERELLDYRYINCYQWSDVASLLYVGERTARWRHAKILKKLFPQDVTDNKTTDKL